jgi:hypothetical protein
MKVIVSLGLLLAVLAIQGPALAQGTIKTGLQSLSGGLPAISDLSSDFTWTSELMREKFYIEVPKGAGSQPCGVLVFVSPTDECVSVPQSWGSVLREKRLIFIAPQNAGNKQPVARRMGLAVLAAGKLLEMAKIDTNRVYVAGFSGGARMASHVSFLCPALFSGVFAVCGVDYCQKVPRRKATKDDEYGYFSSDEQQAEKAKKKVRYVLVTGSKDFRYGNILDIYNGGFLKDDYQVKLIDVPGMEHAVCSSKALSEGLSFLEKKADTVIVKKRFDN